MKVGNAAMRIVCGCGNTYVLIHRLDVQHSIASLSIPVSDKAQEWGAVRHTGTHGLTNLEGQVVDGVCEPVSDSNEGHEGPLVISIRVEQVTY